jgi:D-amino-acid oxidase
VNVKRSIAMASPTKSLAPIVVIGAGIIGLTTAVRLLQSQVGSTRQVHIIAAHDYQDPLDAEYASTAAGAHHVSFAEDGEKGKRQREWDLRSESSGL